MVAAAQSRLKRGDADTSIRSMFGGYIGIVYASASATVYGHTGRVRLILANEILRLQLVSRLDCVKAMIDSG
ncbi:hypothetical protein BDV26DRAFT_294828 [Aspergillus bertholletiae]|uniref:Uncharacterized protein n=1 Tax=Aspergillus bertholletiae TaxID=1226010 RepID=A0A5N7B0S8_9EURO|nr:hypothetical protein BDV26DRAFT_294828 [Aspergillus bertholletiae]